MNAWNKIIYELNIFFESYTRRKFLLYVYCVYMYLTIYTIMINLGLNIAWTTDTTLHRDVFTRFIRTRNMLLNPIYWSSETTDCIVTSVVRAVAFSKFVGVHHRPRRMGIWQILVHKCPYILHKVTVITHINKT